MAELVGQLEGAVTFTPSEIAMFPRAGWFVGSGPPSDVLGTNGELYLDKDMGDIYQKSGRVRRYRLRSSSRWLDWRQRSERNSHVPGGWRMENGDRNLA